MKKSAALVVILLIQCSFLTAQTDEKLKSDIRNTVGPGSPAAFTLN